MITNRKAEGFQRRLMQRLAPWPTDRLQRAYKHIAAELARYAGMGNNGHGFILHCARRAKLIRREIVINAIVARRLANDSDTVQPKPVLVYKKLAPLRDDFLRTRRDIAIYKKFKQVRSESKTPKKTTLIAAEVREEFPDIEIGTIMNIYYKQAGKERRRKKSA